MKKKFKSLVNQLKCDIQFVEEIDVLNNQLRSRNWPFIHPYNYGYEIDKVRNVLAEPSSEVKIFEIYARGFLDLRTTSAFFEGYFKVRPFMKDYAYLVDSSIILCLQKDFAGAINTLIPAIEGILRDYMVSRGKQKSSLINIDSLLKIKEVLSNDYCDIQMEFYRNEQNLDFDKNQKKKLRSLHNQYVSLWLSQLTQYLKMSLYADTRKTKSTDKLNRHNIIHGFNNDPYYSFSNYLRIFNCLHFISWIFGHVYKDQPILVHEDESEIDKRWKCYIRILAVTKALDSTKKSLLGNDNSRNVDYSLYMDPFYKYHFEKTENAVKRSFRYTNNYFDW